MAGIIDIHTHVKRYADGVFFLVIGLELERELYSGELSNLKKVLLPIFAAIGGMASPALIHFTLTSGTPTQPGIVIPMATDIAFALGVLAILGNRIPARNGSILDIEKQETTIPEIRTTHVTFRP